ncbi:MAG: amidohydrolase family protein [Flavobacteriales bacterium]|nr:amidohydrolase family protein [Flavobacteriales bacterium]
MRTLRYLLAAALLTASTARAQENVPVNGPHGTARPVHAFIHATLHPAPGEVLRDATLLVQDERVVGVGTRLKVPAGAVVHDVAGLHIWPGLVDPYGSVGVPAKAPKEQAGGTGYWNRAVHGTTRADELYTHNTALNAKLREQGITTVITHRPDGIVRGSGCAVLLADRAVNLDVLQPRSSAHFSFNKGSSPEEYPSSLMGSIALLRQTLHDARWYAGQGSRAQSDADLEGVNALLGLPLVFESSERNDIGRIARIGREFGLRFTVRGTGDEYARLADVVAAGTPLILPLTMPEAYDVEDPFAALEVTLAELKHWELAPVNAARLDSAGVPFAFTLHGLKEPADAWPALRRMVLAGLDTASAIAALTTRPAAFFGLSERVGALREGMLANFLITSGHLLEQGNQVHETWVAGRRFAHKPYGEEDVVGVFDLNLRSVILRMEVSGRARPEAEVYRPAADTVRVKARFVRDDQLVTLEFDGRRLGFDGPVRLNGIVHDRGGIWDGQGQLPGGEWIAWSAVRQAVRSKEKEGSGDRVLDSLYRAPVGAVWYPLTAFGGPALPDTEVVVFRHATVWTNGPQGILRDADVCISGGRIVGVGERIDLATLFPGRTRPEVIEVNATGKHLTCGIIDEHSHLGIARGVNEGGQAVSAEVRIGDVTDPDHVGLYRDLAGGVTAVQQLHGSANPIGGQSALIKLRWGLGAEALHIDGAPGFIKFALGENVKQSNWPNDGSRFPQTRMGVEQVMYDAFHRARAYGAAWDRTAPRPEPKPDRKGRRRPAPTPAAELPRRDLELDALVEVLEGKRYISCHSYVQGEIAMLMDVADSMGFTVNTFTHVLEGYKVAPKLKAHGAGASTFSDWWAYKMEVGDAIPYNAALLWREGVTTCLNSDDAEMSRRLNQEAAKAVKYGGVPPEEAWKMVTLNPARLLHLDQRMGSVEVGKDADLVLWSADPLSIDAKCEMTFVDGVRYYDAVRHKAWTREVVRERERLVARMLAAKKAGAPVRKPQRKDERNWECESLGERP